MITEPTMNISRAAITTILKHIHYIFILIFVNFVLCRQKHVGPIWGITMVVLSLSHFIPPHSSSQDRTVIPCKTWEWNDPWLPGLPGWFSNHICWNIQIRFFESFLISFVLETFHHFCTHPWTHSIFAMSFVGAVFRN